MKVDPSSLRKWSGIRGILEDKRVLIVDDEDSIQSLMQDIFKITGAEYVSVYDGESALQMLRSRSFDLVLLDIMMPNVDGLEVCRQIREFSEVPIIIVSALDQSEIVVSGLESGADDYVTKPFEIDILIARVRAVLRRKELIQERMPDKYNDGYLTFDPVGHRVSVMGQSIWLSKLEYDVLSYLVEHAGRVRTFSQIMRSVWGDKAPDFPDYLHAYISQLRKKLEKDPENPDYLLSAPQVGYRFVPHYTN